MSYNSGIAIGLGDWGYVFWDEGRLKASGITSDNFEDANQKWKIKVRPPSHEPSGGELLGDFWNVDKRGDQGRSKDSVGLTPKEWKESRRGELGAVAVNRYKLYQPIRWDYSDFDEDSEPGDDQSDDADSN